MCVCVCVCVCVCMCVCVDTHKHTRAHENTHIYQYILHLGRLRIPGHPRFPSYRGVRNKEGV